MQLLLFFFFFIYISFLFLFFFTYFNNSFIVDFYLFGGWGIDVSLAFVFDFLSLGFFCSVSFISFAVFWYVLFYIEGTSDLRRFLFLVFLFVLSMFILVFSGNFVLTMVGWDGLGLVSFCLVIFYGSPSSLESGLVTFLSNRVGDSFFLVSFLFFVVGGTFMPEGASLSASVVYFLLLVFGCFTNSAQVPFSAWLPAAIAAPTPVSSLVHSSTLVTAGVYVLLRFNYIFFFFGFLYLKLFFVLTIVVAGFCASAESDLNKVVAMSTLSQLGMILFVLSVGTWVLCFIHVIVHSYFNSILFLSTGSLMSQAMSGQDSRFYGSSSVSLMSFLFFLVGGMCLSGFPFFLGFYSNDFIIVSCSYGEGLLLYLLFLGGCALTVVYSIRLIFTVFSSRFKLFPCISFFEGPTFFSPVLFLFLNCWGLGGLVYWYFLSDLFVFLFFSDVFFGVFLVLLSFVIYFGLKYSYRISISLMTLVYFRWIFSGGASFFFGSIKPAGFEGSWVEVFGGGGSYRLLFLLGSVSNLFYRMSAGSLLLSVLVFLFYFF